MFNPSVSVTAPSKNASAFEVFSYLTTATTNTDSAFCHNLLLAGWIRLGTEKAPSTNSANRRRTLESSFITCSPTFTTALYNITVDPTGHILGSNRTSRLSTNTAPPASFSNNNTTTSTALFAQADQLIGFASANFIWHADAHTRDWPNSLLKAHLGTNALVDPATAAPVATTLAPVVADMYSGLFAILLSLNTHIFVPASPDQPSAATTVAAAAEETRLFMSPVMFCIAITLLAVDIVVAIWYYTCRPERFLPHMPTSIASLLGYVAAGSGYAALERLDTDPDIRFGYGWTQGADRKRYLGIDVQENVVPIFSKGYKRLINK